MCSAAGNATWIVTGDEQGDWGLKRKGKYYGLHGPGNLFSSNETHPQGTWPCAYPTLPHLFHEKIRQHAPCPFASFCPPHPLSPDGVMQPCPIGRCRPVCHLPPVKRKATTHLVHRALTDKTTRRQAPSSSLPTQSRGSASTTIVTRPRFSAATFGSCRSGHGQSSRTSSRPRSRPHLTGEVAACFVVCALDRLHSPPLRAATAGCLDTVRILWRLQHAGATYTA